MSPDAICPWPGGENLLREAVLLVPDAPAGKINRNQLAARAPLHGEPGSPSSGHVVVRCEARHSHGRGNLNKAASATFGWRARAGNPRTVEGRPAVRHSMSVPPIHGGMEPGSASSAPYAGSRTRKQRYEYSETSRAGFADPDFID